MPRNTVRPCWANTTAIGTFTGSRRSSASWNTGVSLIVSRTYRPTRTSAALAKMAEQRRSDRPREKRNRKCRQRGERGRGRIRGREKQPWKHEHRRGRVNVEIEEFDRRADQAGEQHLARTVDAGTSRGGDDAHRTMIRCTRIGRPPK